MAKTFRHINFKMLWRVIGWLLMIEAGFMLMPLVAAVVFEESDIKAFAIATGVTLAAGAGLTFGLRPQRSDMGKYEGFLLTSLVWVVFSIFGMLPFVMAQQPLSVTDAFFEAMSGFTTTGCSVLPSVEIFSRSLGLWRCVMQWIGGMGIILFTLAVLPMLNSSGGMQMFNAEVTGITHEKLRPRVSQTAKSLWGVYISLTIVLVGLLCLGPMSVFDSLCHAMSTISTGGFSTSDASLAHWHSNYVNVVVCVFMFLGGTSFTLIFRAVTGKWRSVWSNDVFRFYIGVIVVMYLCFVAAIVCRGMVNSWEDVTINPLFQVVSTISSTGLQVCDFMAWGPFVMALVMMLMFSGACAGSTSGGAKLDRLLLLGKNSRNELYRVLHVNAVTPVRIGGRAVAFEIVTKAVAFLIMYVMVIIIGCVLLTALGLPLMDSAFSAFSCVSNTGYGASVTGYGQDFTIMPTAGKWILSALMLIGRLELFTVLVLFTPWFWRK